MPAGRKDSCGTGAGIGGPFQKGRREMRRGGGEGRCGEEDGEEEGKRGGGNSAKLRPGAWLLILAEHELIAMWVDPRARGRDHGGCQEAARPPRGARSNLVSSGPACEAGDRACVSARA